MKDLSALNEQLKDLDASEFEKQIQGAITQAKQNEDLMSKLKEEYKKEEINDKDLESIIFVQVRDEFTKSIINYLEEFYEGLRSLVMEGVTEKGLKKMNSFLQLESYSYVSSNNVVLFMAK